MQGLSTLRSGLIAQQYRINTIANNIANVNTTGFRSSSVRFADTLYTTMTDPVKGGGDLQLGTGVLVSSTKGSFLQGAAESTNNTLDFSLDGDGFFTVENNGETLYTRNGAFCVSNETGGQYLVTQQGYYVLDESGGRITIPDTANGDIRVASDGSLSTEDGTTFAKLGVKTFTNNEGLASCGGTCFKATVASGEAMESTATVRQGVLEESNVNLVQEMTQLIRAQKCYSLAARAVNTLDEMQQTANNLWR